MKNKLLILKQIFAIAILVTLFACKNKSSNTSDNGNKDYTENYIPKISINESGYDQKLSTDKDSDNVVMGDSTYWENTYFSTIVTVVYSGKTAEVLTSNTDIKSYVTNADVALDLTDVGNVEIITTGASEDGQLKIYGNSAIKLTMNGLKLQSAKSAAINVQNESMLYLHLNNGTQNYICDAQSQTNETYYKQGVTISKEKRNGALYCKGSMAISGSGLLELDGKKKHGISVKGSATIRPGVTIAINDATDNCIKAKNITILGGYIWAKTSADAGKCLSSNGDITIKGGQVKLYTSGGSVFNAKKKDTSSPAGIKVDGNMVISGGKILCVSTGDGGKGINVDGHLTINAGTIDVATTGSKCLYDAELDLDTSPKGVKADGEIIINGGLLNIQVTGKSEGSEGLESKSKITINEGEVIVHAYNDAINLGSDNPIGIEINGGKIYAISDNNDGIDSNNKLWINGGLVIASGASGYENGLDCDDKDNFIVKGGTLIGTGSEAIAISNSCTQKALICNNISVQAGELLVVIDETGKPILKYEMPRTINDLVLFFSSPDIKSGTSYTVYRGGSLKDNTIRWKGWFDDGYYTTGTPLGTYIPDSTTTIVKGIDRSK